LNFKVLVRGAVLMPLFAAVVAQAQSTAKPPYAEIRIGVSQSLTGVLSPFGVSATDGIKLAAENVNARGGVNGMQIRLIIDDEASDKNKTLAHVQKHIDRDLTLAELSPTGTGLAAAVGPVANQSKIAIVGTAAGGNARMATGSGPYSFRVSMPDDQIFPFEVKMVAKDIGAKTAALLYINDDGWGVSVAPIMKKALEDAGLQVVATENYSKTTLDFSALITKLQQMKPDIVGLMAGSEDGPQFLIQAKQRGLRTVYIGGNPFNDTAVIKRAGDAADGLVVGTSWFVGNETAANKQFVTDFRTRYGREPNQFNAQGYTGMALVADAIKRANLTGDLKKDRERIKDAIAATKAYVSPIGPITFDETRTPKVEAGSVIVTQVRGGAFQRYPAKP
jgi:branched-chain amino acid transport system substrate-binding protein